MTYLLIYEEIYIVETTEMDSTHVMKKDTNRITNKIQQVLHWVGNHNNLGEISPMSVIAYA